MFRLRADTPPAWGEAIAADFVSFLQDHGHNERKVANQALTLAQQNHRRVALVADMIELAQEELGHFKQVHDLLAARGHTIGQDKPDPYTGPLRKLLRKRDQNEYLLDRLILFSLIEARGCERFKIASEVLPEPELRDFYRELFACEARHHGLFLDHARTLFGRDVADARMDTMLDAEAEIVRGLPIRAALH
ncbi:MAG: tRNA-(ms[2]io[6]A)-hydroxylase [Deltaproteobacteria bacterium]|nr:tRNA-(ms[2]io[6]A)-hydroxylase [Deltaproteobacteria bacterium]